MLKNPIQQLTLFFDMEWVPDADAARRLFDLSPEVDEVDAMQKLWQGGYKYDEESNPRPFLKYMFSRVVSIAFLSRRTIFIDGQRRTEFRLNSFPELPLNGNVATEAEIIERFLASVGKYRPQLVGYNSTDSDLQVLIQRALINEVSAPEFCRRPEDKFDKSNDYFARWENENHLDIIRFFSNGNRTMTPRLDDLARACGFPGKIDVKGEQVTDLWLSGDLRKIIEYNQTDALNTYLVWLRLVHFCGKLAGEEYFEETEQFRSFLESECQKPEKAFVADFLAKWPA